MAGTQTSQKQSDEMAVFEILQQHLVDSIQDVIERQLHGSEAAHVSPSESHDQRGAESVTLGVGHGDEEGAIVHENEIEIVATGFVGRMRRSSDVEAWYDRRSRIESLLNVARELKLKLLLLFFSEFCDVLRDRNEVSQPPGFVAHRSDGLLRPVKFASLFAVDDHAFEGGSMSEMSPHLPVELRVVQTRPQDSRSFAHCFFAAVAGGRFEGWIHILDYALGIRSEPTFAGRTPRRADPTSRFSEFCPLLLRGCSRWSLRRLDSHTGLRPRYQI